MASSVIRIDFKNTSAILNLSDIAYITFVEELDEETGNPIVSLRIFLTFGEQACIVIQEIESIDFEELKTIYMDLFTKWKKKVDKDKEDEMLLYTL